MRLLPSVLWRLLNAQLKSLCFFFKEGRADPVKGFDLVSDFITALVLRFIRQQHVVESWVV